MPPLFLLPQKVRRAINGLMKTNPVTHEPSPTAKAPTCFWWVHAFYSLCSFSRHPPKRPFCYHDNAWQAQLKKRGASIWLAVWGYNPSPWRCCATKRSSRWANRSWSHCVSTSESDRERVHLFSPLYSIHALGHGMVPLTLKAGLVCSVSPLGTHPYILAQIFLNIPSGCFQVILNLQQANSED